MKALVGAAAVALAVLIAGCGSDDAPAAKPKPKGDPRPRVEGEWRVLYTSQDASQLDDRATWTVTPKCKFGACGFRVKSNKGIKLRMRFDKVVGDYTDRTRTTYPCGNEETGETFIEDAYVMIDQVTLEPSVGIKNGRGTFATEMTGTRETQSHLRPEHADSGCDGEEDWERADLRLIRTDPPRGRKFYGNDPNAPQPVGD